MKHLKPIQVDKSWVKEYDDYLQHISQGNGTKGMSEFGLTIPTQISDSHTLTLTNLFKVVKAKKPIQNIYKRPI